MQAGQRVSFRATLQIQARYLRWLIKSSKPMAELMCCSIMPGISGVGLLHESSLEAWDKVINVNIRGVFLTSKYVLPHMIEKR